MVHDGARWRLGATLAVATAAAAVLALGLWLALDALKRAPAHWKPDAVFEVHIDGVSHLVIADADGCWRVLRPDLTEEMPPSLLDLPGPIDGAAAGELDHDPDGLDELVLFSSAREIRIVSRVDGAWDIVDDYDVTHPIDAVEVRDREIWVRLLDGRWVRGRELD